jgi:hypothetical protein
MICGAEACKLGAMIHGAELRVHFLKSFQKGSTCENLSQKWLKIKKVGYNPYFSKPNHPYQTHEHIKIYLPMVGIPEEGADTCRIWPGSAWGMHLLPLSLYDGR